MKEKLRLDIAMVNNGLVPTREKAKALIMAGQVYVNNQKADKAGLNITKEQEIELRGNPLPFVSRGGLKLKKAVEVFNLDINGKICMDIGASTGGFTDCMLQNGAEKVFAVDVGYGQLAWKLRTDERVVNMERTNIRFVREDDIGEQLDFISIDVAFISLKLVLPVAKSLLKKSGEIVCLIKPQFEAGREKVGKKGVVRDPLVHKEVIENIVNFARDSELSICGLNYSPIKGPEGNIEYLLYLKSDKNADDMGINKDFINNIVENSHLDIA